MVADGRSRSLAEGSRRTISLQISGGRTWWRFDVLIDTFGNWVGVAGAGALAGLAVVTLVIAAWRERERALLPFICCALIVATVLFWLLFLGGERLFPH